MSLHKVSHVLSLDALSAFALELVDISGDILRKRFHQATFMRSQIEYKRDGSPVTVVDREVEAALSSRIKEEYTNHSVLGEELETKLDDGKYNADFLWVIDPIDGTKSFISGNPLFGTLLALLYQGKPLLGVMDLPLLKQRWWGKIDSPTYYYDGCDNYVVRTTTCITLQQAIGRCTTPDMFRGKGEEAKEFAFRRLQDKIAYFLFGGDCFCYGQLASGLVDLVLESQLAPYDFLALVPIVEGAGGIISDWQGRDLNLYSKGNVLATGDKKMHEAALKILNFET